MKLKFSLFLLFVVFLALNLKAEEWFEIEVKVITTGDNQPQREIGTFGAEVPEGGKGHLKRSVLIKNQTRNKTNEIDFEINFQPQKTASGVFHLLLTSEATPKVGKSENKFRDLLFEGRSNQIVEIFSDPETGTRLLISVAIREKEIQKEAIESLKAIFKCKVEKIKGKTKEVIDSYDLQAVGENPVKRTLTQKVPVLVEGDSGEVATSGFKQIDSGNIPVHIKAGEGFSYTPPIDKKNKKPKEKQPSVRKKRDTRIPSKYQEDIENEVRPSESKEEEVKTETEQASSLKSSSFNWEKEEFSYEISILEAYKGTIKTVVKMEGTLFDPELKQMKTLEKKEETKTFSNGEIATFFLQSTEEEGFVLTVQAYF